MSIQRMMVALKQLSWVCVVSVLASSLAFAEGDETAVVHLSRLLKPLTTYQADFEQTLLSAQGQTLQNVKGQMKAKRPGQFYWHTEPPLEQTVVTDGQRVWIHDPDLEQVTIQDLAQQLSATPALLLSGEVGRIEEAYDVSYANPQPGQPVRPDFMLKPKGTESLFQWLTLHFVEDTLYAMSLVDTLGQKTLLRFDNPKKNPELSDALFQFTPPPGADVIEQTAQ
ncbi:MAG: outer membrane lipoprotein chaperone LolA [Hahellaceae bacterium]|nr:outer membrane lipoprotein chaperone LolA [Hahellaceae bacterium]